MTMGALCEAVVAEAKERNVFVYYDAATRDIVGSNNVRPTVDDADATGSDAHKYTDIDNAWFRIRKAAVGARVPVENFYREGSTLLCSRIRIPVTLASENLKSVCKNEYPKPKRPAAEGEGEGEAPAKRAAFNEQASADEAHEGATGDTAGTETVRDYFQRVIASLEEYGGTKVTMQDIAETRTGEPFFVKHCGLPAAEATHIWGAVLAVCSAKRPASDDKAEAPARE